MMRSRHTTVITLICLSLVCLLSLIAVVCYNADYLIYGVLLGAPSERYAKYDDMKCWGSEEINTISTRLEFSEKGRLAKLYVQAPDGEVFYVPELTENMTDSWLDDVRAKSGIDRRTELMDILGISWSFEEGKIVRFSIWEKSEFAVGVSPQGPFHRLPMDHETMRELFGNDFEWVFSQSTGIF